MIRDRLDTQTDEANPPLRGNLCRKGIVGHEIDAFQRAMEALDCSVGTSMAVTQNAQSVENQRNVRRARALAIILRVETSALACIGPPQSPACVRCLEVAIFSAGKFRPVKREAASHEFRGQIAAIRQ